MNWRFHSTYGVMTAIVVAAVVAWGFVLVGSPGSRRIERFDAQRLRDLQTIALEVHNMVVDNKEKRTIKAPLPKTMEEVSKRARDQKISLRDPETGEPYDYRVKDESTFELCATFVNPRDSDQSVFWNHPSGTHCFTINVLDPPPFYSYGD